MKKWNLILFMALILLTPIVYSVDMCTSSPFVDTNCRMVTPVLNCPVYNYSILNTETSEILVKNNLTLLNDSIYYFNFSKGVGDYLVTLCDDTTREVRVGKEDDNMGWLSIIITLGLMAVMFSVFSFKINDPKLQWAKILMFLLGVLNVFLMGFLPYIISVNPGNIGAFTPMAIGYLSVNGLLLVYFIWMYGIHLFINLFRDNIDKQESENNKDKL